MTDQNQPGNQPGSDPPPATSHLDTIIGRAIRDTEFRARFLDNPLVAAQVEGYSLSYADRIALKSINETSAAAFLDRFVRDPTLVMWCTDQKCYEYESNLGDILKNRGDPGPLLAGGQNLVQPGENVAEPGGGED